MRNRARADRLFWIGLAIAGVVAACWLRAYPGPGWGDDWAGYLMQAHAIAAHDIARVTTANAFIVSHSSIVIGPVLYPWGLPLLLLAESAVAPPTFLTFSIANVVMLLLSAWVTRNLARRFVDDGAAAGAALMLVLNPAVLPFVNEPSPDIPFMLATLVVFALMERRPDTRYGRAALYAGVGAAAFVACAFRLNGLLMLPVIGLWQCLPDRPGTARTPARRRVAAVFIACAVFSSLAVVWSIALPDGGSSYVGLLRDATASRVLNNIWVNIASTFYFFTEGAHRRMAEALFGPLIVLGAVTSWRRTAHLSAYWLLTFVLYSVWPFRQGFRFFLPVTPLVVIMLAIGAAAVARSMAAWPWTAAWRRLPQMLAAAFVVWTTVLIVSRPRVVALPGPVDASSREMFDWVRTSTPPDAVIAFFKPRLMWLNTGRLGVTAWPADLAQASYLVYAPWAGADAAHRRVRRARRAHAGVSQSGVHDLPHRRDAVMPSRASLAPARRRSRHGEPDRRTSPSAHVTLTVIQYGHIVVTMTKASRKTARTGASIPAATFKAECLALLDQVAEARTSYVITKRGRPVAEVVPVSRTRVPLAGSVTIKGDIVGPVLGDWDASGS